MEASTSEIKRIIKPFFIQRGAFREVPIKKENELYSVVSIDLMLSGEFYDECLKQSLNRMIDANDKYIAIEVDTIRNSKNQPMVLYFNKEIGIECFLEAIEFMKDEQNLKEWCGLSSYLKNSKNIGLKNFWWDIQNDYFVFFGDKNLIIDAMNNMAIRSKTIEVNQEIKKSVVKKLIKRFTCF